jgi:hypothetical protein
VQFPPLLFSPNILFSLFSLLSFFTLYQQSALLPNRWRSTIQISKKYAKKALLSLGKRKAANPLVQMAALLFTRPMYRLYFSIIGKPLQAMCKKVHTTRILSALS